MTHTTPEVRIGQDLTKLNCSNFESRYQMQFPRLPTDIDLVPADAAAMFDRDTAVMVEAKTADLTLMPAVVEMHRDR